MGKYQLDTKSKVAAAKYQDGKKPAVSNKKDKINQIREAYLQKKNEKKQAGEWLESIISERIIECLLNNPFFVNGWHHYLGF